MRFFIFALTLLFSSVAWSQTQLHQLSPAIGHWITPDGSARQHFYWGVGERIVHGYMEIKVGDSWEKVAEGSYHWDPVAKTIRATFVGIKMGIALFYGKGGEEGGNLVFYNRTQSEKGEWMDSVETWTFGNPDSFEYVIERVEAGTRKPWYRGQWLRDKSKTNE
ncbi:hypothetical protein ACFSJ3_11040 [Corallincola platygyrae]|uniref:DUF1579 domain-containing protein n=1 Tax=Corallincola platygyrae TaxID=1193278 RepID=A0ABW4XMQ1_9GAMM